jgi:hypothetical protein
MKKEDFEQYRDRRASLHLYFLLLLKKFLL